MKWLNYHHLFYFRTIANEGGIARAAVKLRLGQPTLSTQLKHLEDAVGRPLFERKNRSLVLTEAGKIALDYAENIFRAGDELLQVLADGAISGRTDVKIGALDSVPTGQLDPFIRTALDKAALVRDISRRVANVRHPDTWHPVGVICPRCGKVGTTIVTDWNGEQVHYECRERHVEWATVRFFKTCRKNRSH